MKHHLLSTCAAAIVIIINSGCAQESARRVDRGATIVAPAADHERMLLELPTASSLRRYHELFSSEPHVAGTQGDQRMIATLVREFEALGLEVEVHEFEALLPVPVSASLQIVASPEDEERGVPPLDLPIQERQLAQDPYTRHPDLTIGFNAYSASGDVTAEVVYANYGTKEDFAKLRELGVDVAGKIVLARYGGNFRGYKVKFAQEAGAVGVVIFTDPADSGFTKGAVYPESGWANDSYIQRGSINTLPYPGDPLTPGVEASADARRLDVNDVALPRIPSQPVGYGAAKPILALMQGPAAPQDWQGGLPVTYRLSGGPDLLVRLRVEQTPAIQRTANVLATLRGSRFSDEKIYIGCHHDAWSFGAGDPNSGTMLVYEAARCFAQAAQRGWRPKRSIVFCNWGAEEYGIIGSTEWVEAHREELNRDAVAYINLDMATMGPDFGASCSPPLRDAIAHAARLVPQARSDDGERVFDAWTAKSNGEPRFGNLGGGSDHVGFLCHVGVPSCSLGAGGCEGVSYHSNYETLHWYRQVVGEDYEPAVMLTRMVNLVAARLADETLLPFDAAAYVPVIREELQRLSESESGAPFKDEIVLLVGDVDEMGTTALRAVASIERARLAGRLGDADIRRLNQMLIRLERCWIGDGLPGRPWYRHVLAASDPDSGYAAWVLPALRATIDEGDDKAFEDAARGLRDGLQRCSELLSNMDVIAWTASQRVMGQ